MNWNKWSIRQLNFFSIQNKMKSEYRYYFKSNSLERPLYNAKFGCMHFEMEINGKNEFFHFYKYFIRCSLILRSVQICHELLEWIATAVECSGNSSTSRNSCIQTPSFRIRALTYSSRMNPSNHPLNFLFSSEHQSLFGVHTNVSRH